MLRAFERVASAYGHGKQKGLVLSAAMLHFLEADPRDQAACVEAVMRAELDRGVAKLLREVRRRQGYAAALRDTPLGSTPGSISGSLADASGGGGLRLASSSSSSEVRETKAGVRPRRAAKKRKAARKGIKRLPTIEDLA